MSGESRRRFPSRRALCFSTSLAVSFSAASALAAGPTKDDCIDANRQAQTLRRSGKLHAAQAALHVCASQSCPAVVSDDCTSRLDEVERAMPSLVFDVRDGAGRDLTRVKVSMDGKPFAEALDGTALTADPGEHTFVFEVAEEPPVTEQLVLHEGDKGRHERIVIGDRAVATKSAPAPVEARARAEAPPPRQGQRIAGLVVGGVGILSVGLGAVFGVSASSSWSASQSACGSPTACPNHAQAVSEYNSASSDALISTIGFIAGGALITGGLILFFTAPAARESALPPAATAVHLVPSVAPGTAALLVRGTF
jgi:hypothetical protein